MPSDKDEIVRDTASQRESQYRGDDEYNKPPGKWKDPSKPRIKFSKTEWIGVATLIAVFVQSLFNYWTLKEIEKTTKATEIQAKANVDQLPLLKDSIDVARKAIEQNTALIGAAQKQADASLTQANVSQQMADQNEKLIKATEIQARTSQVAAKAAEESAKFSRDTFFATNKPELTFRDSRFDGGLVAHEKPVFRTVLFNTGNLTADGYFEDVEIGMGRGGQPTSFAKIRNRLRFSIAPQTPNTFTFEIGIDLTPEDIQALNSEAMDLILTSKVSYTDQYGRNYVLPMCVKYSRLTLLRTGTCFVVEQPKKE
jgi:hypothetical protein